MHSDSNLRLLIDFTLKDLRSTWKSLALTDIVFKIITFIVLTPLVGVLFRSFIALSGSAILSDQDILFFFLRPAGWACLIGVGALWLGIIALEQAALMGILAAKAMNQRASVIGAMHFAASNALAVIRLTGRAIGCALLAIAPIGALGAAAYFTLLSEYDINFYLKEKPPVFWVALVIGAILVFALAAVALRLGTSWFFGLPLVLFEDVSPAKALAVSRDCARGHRRTLLVCILGWAAAISVISAIATGLVGLLGRLLIPDSTASLRLLSVTIGVTLLLWIVVNLAVDLLRNATIAAMVFTLYRRIGGGERTIEAKRSAAMDESLAGGTILTRRRLLAWCTAGVVAAACVGAYALHSVRLNDRVQIMAHRGSSKTAPENTMAAFRQAILDRADFIELDVQETADDQVVVFHDSDFMKLAGVNLRIWDATIDRLKDIDIGGWKSPQFKDERTPTLAAVLDECKDKIRVNIELKYYGHDRRLEQRVAEIVSSRAMDSQVVAMSLNADGVRKMKAIRPNWQVGLLMSVYAGDLSKLDADFVAVNAGFVSRRFVRAAHKHGKHVYVWTVNDAPTMSTMIGRGVDGLITDKPALARSVLEQRAEMSAPQRLLLELGPILGVTPEFVEQ